MAAKGTPAIEAVRRAGVEHTVHEYPLPVATAREPRHSYGIEAAAALGIEPARLFKTLVVAADGRLGVGVVPVSSELDLKAIAGALGARTAAMAEQADAERATGDVVGGISPLGQRRRLPTVIDSSAFDHATIFVSAGRRGLQLELAPADLVRLADARVDPIRRP